MVGGTHFYVRGKEYTPGIPNNSMQSTIPTFTFIASKHR